MAPKKATSARSKVAPRTTRKRPPASGIVKKVRRWKPGTIALREIRRYQKSTQLLIGKLPFARLFKEILHDVTQKDYRVQSLALQCLQEATEDFITRKFTRK
jgi:histone H3